MIPLSKWHSSAAIVTAAVYAGVVFTSPVIARNSMRFEIQLNGRAEGASVNTAIDHSVMSASLAREMRIAGTSPLTITDGMLETRTGRSAAPLQVRIGDAVISRLKVAILSDAEVANAARSKTARFVLGADLFEGRIVEMAFPGGALTVVAAATACEGASYVLPLGKPVGTVFPVIGISVNGSRTTALIDPQIDDALVVGAMNQNLPMDMVDLHVGSKRQHVRARRREDTPGVGIVPFIIGRRAFGSSVVTIDFPHDRICVK